MWGASGSDMQSMVFDHLGDKVLSCKSNNVTQFKPVPVDNFIGNFKLQNDLFHISSL